MEGTISVGKFFCNYSKSLDQNEPLDILQKVFCEKQGGGTWEVRCPGKTKGQTFPEGLICIHQDKNLKAPTNKPQKIETEIARLVTWVFEHLVFELHVQHICVQCDRCSPIVAVQLFIASKLLTNQTKTWAYSNDEAVVADFKYTLMKNFI